MTGRFNWEEDQLNELEQAFRIFDSENKGYLTVSDVKGIWLGMGMEATTAEVGEFLMHMDNAKHQKWMESGEERENLMDREVKIKFDDFRKMTQKKIQSKLGADEIKKVFDLLDGEKKKYLSFKSLKENAQQLRLELSDRDIHDMIEYADRNGDGFIQLDEFYQMVMRRNASPFDLLWDSDEGEDGEEREEREGRGEERRGGER